MFPEFNLFTVLSAALMGYSFALLLVIKRQARNDVHSAVAKALPLFPLFLMFYFVLRGFEVTSEIFSLLAVISMIFVSYKVIA